MGLRSFKGSHKPVRQLDTTFSVLILPKQPFNQSWYHRSIAVPHHYFEK